MQARALLLVFLVPFPPNAYILANISGATGCNSTTSAYTQFPTGTLNAGGYAPVLPTTNGRIFASGNTDPYFQSVSIGGCTTGSSAGNNCASPVSITWGTALPDTNYNVFCTGYNPTGTPSAPYVVNGSQTTAGVQINYFAITAVASSYASMFCTAHKR